MARQSTVLAIALLAFTAVSGTRAALSAQNGGQKSSGVVATVHRQLLTDLKVAQEQAGIFVDDAYLFESDEANRGRKLLQVDATQILSSPDVLGTLLELVSQGLSVGGFPGAALNLPGGSNVGYAPSDNSYCLFSTRPNYGSAKTAPNLNITGPEGGSPSDLPGGFSCREGTQAGPDSFLVTYNNKTYVCQGNVASSPSSGRRLLQQTPPLNLTEDTVGALFNAGLTSIGLPIWNCIVSTTPQGNTTLGQSTLAVLNDLGIVAEHFLTYLNGNGELTYQQNVENNFVSLQDPLYPNGPRWNFSIDFSVVDKDRELFREIFGFPAPPTPPPSPSPPPSPNSPSGGGGGSGGSSNGGSGGSSGGSNSGGSSSSSSGSNSSGSSNSGSSSSGASSAATTTTASPPTPTPTKANVSVFDGYLSGCQAVIGSTPNLDGNFDRTNTYQGSITDGQLSMAFTDTSQYNGQVLYAIPASRSVTYAPLTQATRSQAQFCYDVATLQPAYNPFAGFIVQNSSTLATNPVTTVATFGVPIGVSSTQVVSGLGITIPAPYNLWTYDALGAAVVGDAAGLSFLKVSTQVNNLVTSGANLLTNDSTVYASYAIVVNQAIAQKIVYSTVQQPSGRKLLQTGPPAVDLTNATTVADILRIATQLVPTLPDESTRAGLNPGLGSQQWQAVAQAVANLNAATASSTTPDATQLASYWASTTLAEDVSDLATGDITPDLFAATTTPAAISQQLSTLTLPGTIVPSTSTAPAPTRAVTTTTTQASEKSSSSSGLSHGGKVALAVVFPVIGVLAIAAVIGFFVVRRRRTGVVDASSNNSTVWWRRPFARSGPTDSAV